MWRVLVVVLAMGVSPASAASRQITIEYGMCTGRLRYDPAKVDEAALKATVRLLFDLSVTSMPMPPTPRSPTEVGRVDPKAYAADCEKSRATLLALKPLDLPGIAAFQRMIVAEIEDFCAFGDAQLRAFKDPEALRTYTPAAGACAPYADALSGRSDPNALWSATVKQQCENNVDPARCEKNAASRASGPDADQWRRLYLIETGWNNCAVPFLKVNTGDNDRKREELIAAFTRTFKVKLACDEE